MKSKSLSRRSFVLMIAVAAPAAALMAGACGSAEKAQAPQAAATPKPPAAAAQGASPAAVSGDLLQALQGLVGMQSAMAYVDRVEFHEIAEELEKAAEIDTEYLEKTRNVLAVARVAPWPSQLSAEQQKFVKDLKKLESALVGNNVEGARSTAEALHESQHDVSTAYFAWLVAQKPPDAAAVFTSLNSAEHLLGCIGVQSAQAYAEGADFHDIAEEIEKSSAIDTKHLSTARNVMAVAKALPWPGDLAAGQAKLVEGLQALESALVSNDSAKARSAAGALHESEHDFSEAVFEWLTGQKHDHAAIGTSLKGDAVMLKKVSATALQAAQSRIEAAAFHAMAEDLEKAGKVNTEQLSQLRRVMTVMGMVPWPSEVSPEQQRLFDGLKKMETSIVGNDTMATHEAAEAVHEMEHDLSEAVYGWMAAQ